MDTSKIPPFDPSKALDGNSISNWGKSGWVIYPADKDAPSQAFYVDKNNNILKQYDLKNNIWSAYNSSDVKSFASSGVKDIVVDNRKTNKPANASAAAAPASTTSAAPAAPATTGNPPATPPSGSKGSSSTSSSSADTKVNAAGSSAAETGAAGELLSGIDTTQQVLKNEQAGAYAFWTTADSGLTDDNGNPVKPTYSLLDALNASIKKGYLQAADPTNFFNELKKTDWYAKYQGQGLLAADAYYNNKPQFDKDVSIRTDLILQRATAAGYKLSPTIAKDLATGSMYTAFDANAWQAYQNVALPKAIAESFSHYNVPQTITGGAAFDNQQALKTYAQDMGMGNTYSDGWYSDAANAINDPSKQVDLNAYKKQILDHAIATYQGYGDLLAKGMTVRQIADPYVQTMAKTLEIDPQTIDYSKDKTIQQALGAGGNSQPMPMWQYQQQLRQDPRWALTDNAREEVNGIAHGILRDFGVMS
jgi:hypothetical protein